MKWKAYLPLAVAIVLGLFAARIAVSIVNHAPKEAVREIPMAPAVVAVRDIEPGTTLADTDVVPAQLNAETLPTGTYNSPAAVVGKVTKIALVRGQTLTPNLMADDGAGFGVGATLPAGMRAVTIDITDTTGVAGFILPKCKVDLIATLQVEGKSISKTVLESVTVLAVGGRTNPTTPTDPNLPTSKTVTLIVKPKDVEKVELAATMSRIRLVLRNGRDETVADSDGVTLVDLKGTRKDADPFADNAAAVKTVAATQPAEVTPVAAPKTQSWTVTMIRAGAVSKQAFEVPTAKESQANPAVEPALTPTPVLDATPTEADPDATLTHVDLNH